MRIRKDNRIWGGMKKMTLVRRMIITYLFAPLLLFLLFCGAIIFFVGRSMEEKMQLSMESDLKQSAAYLDETTEALMMVVEQLAFGHVSINLSSMLMEQNPYNKSELVRTISNEVSTISFTNKNIRLLGYYDRNRERFVFVSNGSIEDSADKEEYILSRKYEFIFRGPHKSHARNHQDLVVSVIKKVPGAEGIDAYAEMAVNFQRENSFITEADFFLINEAGEILYRNNEDAEISSEKLLWMKERKSGKSEHRYFASICSESGYQAVITVPERELMKMFENMFPAIFLVLFIFLLVFSAAAFFLLRTVIKPLHIFENEIRGMQEGQFDVVSHQKINIPEYDHLLDEIVIMKEKILELFEETENAQRLQAKSRMEQLLYKINPHFLMNSLDTIHWLAVDKKQEEIDRVAKALNRLLYYNLKMTDRVVTVEDELGAVKQYVILQQTRFSFTYHLELSDNGVKAARVPRFLLQPLIENAIYHGLTENGTITLKITCGKKLEIIVRDDGDGMSQENLDRLLSEILRDKEDNRLGIGLNYVVQILKDKYGEEAVIQIHSKLHEGTEIHISLPFQTAGGKAEYD